MIERSRTLFVGFIAFVLVLITFSSFQKNKQTEENLQLALEEIKTLTSKESVIEDIFEGIGSGELPDLGLDVDYEDWDDSDWTEEYQNRLETREEQCSIAKNDGTYGFDLEKMILNGMNENELRLVVDEKHKILYCELPKVGCTNWKRTMLQLIHPDKYGSMKVENIKSPHGKKGDNGYKYLSEWPPEEQIKMIKTYYKFMFVRHPLERLLSAYRDKVQNFYLKSSYFNKQTQKLKNENPEMVMEMDIEGFHSFVKYLIAKGPGGNWGSRQRHWRRYMDVCKVCSIDWNFIGKMETLNQDTEWVIEDMGVKGLAEYPKRNKTTKHDTMIRYYAGLESSTILKLYQLYKPDFDLFGYDLPVQLLHAGSLG